MNTWLKIQRLKNIKFIPVSESLGYHWYMGKKTAAEKEIRRLVDERKRFEKQETREDRLMRIIDMLFEEEKAQQTNDGIFQELQDTSINANKYALLKKLKHKQLHKEEKIIKAIEKYQLRKEIYLIEKNLVLFDEMDQLV